MKAIKEACAKLKEASIKHALPWTVGEVFHSPLMEPARIIFEKAPVSNPFCPVYQNLYVLLHIDPVEIIDNLLK